MNRASAPSFIALRDPYTGTWDPDENDQETVQLPSGRRSLVQVEEEPVQPVRVQATSNATVLTAFKPLADKFWFIPWIIIGIIGYRWIKERF